MLSCGICETFKNTYFVEHLQTVTSGSCKYSIWTCFEIKDVDKRRRFNRIFQKDETTIPHLKKGLFKGWKYPLRIVLEFFKNYQIYKLETKSLKMLWERVQFSKVWSLQPATLVLAYSFIKHKLLYRWCSSFYVLFRNKHLQNITWWLLPLWNVVQLYLRNITWRLLPLWNVVQLYFLCFSETRILRDYLVVILIIC